MKAKIKKLDTGRGYAWKIDEGFCNWIMPTLTQLKEDGSPSDEAVPVKVRFVSESDWRKIMKLLK